MQRRYTSATSGSGASDVPTVTVIPPLTSDLCIVVVYLRASPTGEVTSVALGSGIFTRLARVVGNTGSLEIWEGHGFAADETDTTVNISLSAGTNSVSWATYLSNGAAPHGAPTVVDLETAFANSTSVGTAAVTPTADDETQMVLSLLAWYTGSTAASSFTHTPGGGEGMWVSDGASRTEGRVYMGSRAPTTVADHGLVATLGSTQEWVAATLVLTPSAPTPHADTHVYKGRAKQSLDTIGAT